MAGSRNGWTLRLHPKEEALAEDIGAILVGSRKHQAVGRALIQYALKKALADDEMRQELELAGIDPEEGARLLREARFRARPESVTTVGEEPAT